METIIYETNQKVIKQYLTPVELWGQLAEECAELAQAALKMQRLSLNNQPAKTAEECRAAVVEEFADISLVYELIGFIDYKERARIMKYKANRWANRLIGQEEGDNA